MIRGRAASASASAAAAAATGADDESAVSLAPSRGCPWHYDRDGWKLSFAIISQQTTTTNTHDDLLYCLLNAPQAAVPALLSGCFLHLRVARSAVTGELRVLFTDIAKSFGMGNTGWQVHPAHRL